MSKFQKFEKFKNQTKKNEQELKKISKHNLDQGLRQILSEQQRKIRWRLLLLEITEKIIDSLIFIISLLLINVVLVIAEFDINTIYTIQI